MRVGVLLVTLLAVATPRVAQAQLLKLLSPGDLSASHASIDDCGKCHQTLKRTSNRLCLSCHTRLADRLSKGLGTHVARQRQPCAACHADHKGEDFVAVEVDERNFDHRPTGLVLDGKHAGLACAKCHASRKTYQGLKSACSSCHDDSHKGKLGTQCLACHSTKSDWKPTRARSDHRTSMAGAHAEAKCTKCHAGGENLKPDNTCKTCHKDPHSGNANTCTICHKPTQWTEVTFDHDTCSMGLTGTHKTTDCVKCHVGWQFGGIPERCEGCHKERPKHGNLGACGRCHDTTSFRKHTFKHSRSRFPLTGKHEAVDCRHCHSGGKFNDLKGKGRKNQCLDCHTQAPKHGDFGNCFPCHDTTSATAFDHGGAERPTTMPVRAPTPEAPAVRVESFPLKGAHLSASCQGCHEGTAKLGIALEECFRCHRVDDPHGGQFGTEGDACVACHREQTWKPSTVTAQAHAPKTFALEGAHTKVECNRCHELGRFRGAPTQCQECHMDRHAGRLGNDCKGCHTVQAFAPVEGFEARHGELSFALVGAHEGVACDTCHVDHAQFSQEQAGKCSTCHADDDAHQGGFGPECEQCHRATTKDWNDREPFDHRETGFPLVLAHSNLPCGQCHAGGGEPAPTPECSGCHRDPHGGGVTEDCASCHAPHTFAVTHFDHATTGWPLRGAHFTAACRSCHTFDDFAGAGPECAACHGATRPDDHTYPSWQCDDCHRETAWSWTRFDHAQTGWPLRGAHKGIERFCTSCHTAGTLPDTDCSGCHRASDETHLFALRDCASCHRPNVWSVVARVGGGFVGFAHPDFGDGRPGLRGAHAITDCNGCHTGPGQTTGLVCTDCHGAPENNPLHMPGWNTDCGDCHDPLPTWRPRAGWRAARP